MNPRFFAYAQRSGGPLSVRALKNRCRNSQRWIVLADTAATFRRLKLAAVGPTSAPNEKMKLKEVYHTAACQSCLSHFVRPYPREFSLPGHLFDATASSCAAKIFFKL